MNNTWNGTISKAMFDLSSVETSYETFTNLTKKYLINCLIGNAHLTGKGTLLEYFEDLVEEVITRGEIALIEVGKQKLLALPKLTQQTLLKEKVPTEHGVPIHSPGKLQPYLPKPRPNQVSNL